ncbi:MAG: N-6 DNA methylase [Leptospiraceae bacterium]|nr:N-6 DNA methylase [Leptospiraceae bacterium]
MSQVKTKDFLNSIIRILKEDRFRSKENKPVNFTEYAILTDYNRKYKGDEDSVVTPILLKILDLLGYKSGVNLIQQGTKGGDKPDFRTFRNNLFLLDAKSTGIEIKPISSNTTETSYNQISRYLRSFEGYKYGILYNLVSIEFYLRDYDINGNFVIKHLPKKINFINLYNQFHQDDFSGEDYENFLWFIENFKYHEIDRSQFTEEIKTRQKEDLIKPDKDLLKATIYNTLSAINVDIKNQVERITKDSYDWEQLHSELQKISFEFKIRNEEDQESILLEEFVKQASYVLLIKLILIRILEDNNLIPIHLYNGGFKLKTEPPFSLTLKRILRESNIDASDIIPSFFEESVYNFVIENEDTFIEILFELSKINFSEIDFDLIGDLYEHYLNYEERKEKGQYYTPHYIVEFILNRVGFSFKDLSKIENKTLLDPACGSGGFLVEAAKRIRMASLNTEGQAKIHIANNLFGTELTAFAHFLCEINLIVQILPLIKNLEKEAQKKIHTLNVYRKDSLLQIYNHQEINGETATPIDLSVTASPKEKKFISLINKNDFDFVVGNPPYVGESGHKDIFKPLQTHKYWKNFYQGKSDYLYYFIILGLSKLKEGGRFSFITTQYWLTADGASQLRKYILNNAKIIEIIDFKGIKLFPEAKGQENIVFVLEKCSEENERKNNKIKIIQFQKDWILDPTETLTTKKTVIKNFDRWQSLLLNKEQFDLFANPDRSSFLLGNFKREEIADVYYSVNLQGELDENAWYIYKKEKDSIQIHGNIVELQQFCNVNQGVVPGPVDTRKMINKLKSSKIKEYKITDNEGVFVLSKEEVEHKSIEKELLYTFYKNSDIKKAFLNFSSNNFLIYTPKIDKISNFPKFKNHIEKYTDYLETRREVEQGKIRWFDLWWAREKSLFESEKIMISYRTNTNSFAYTNHPFYSATDTYYINKKDKTEESLKYIFGVLISDHVLNWLKSGNCKMKGNSFELFTTSVSKIPIPKIDFSNIREKEIHDFLAGDYRTLKDTTQFKHNKTSNTFIKEKGLVDYIIEWTGELYSYKNLGFEFDIDNKNIKNLKYDYQIIANSLSKEIEIQTAERVTIFDNHINDLDSIKNSYIYFGEVPKNFLIKDVLEIAGEGYSLIEPENRLKKHGFNHNIQLKLKNKKIISLEIRGTNLAKFLFDEMQNQLKVRKEISWDDFKKIILPNKEIAKKISDISNSIQIKLIQLDNNSFNSVDKIINNLDILEVKNKNNLNFAYYVLNSLVKELYSDN